MNLKLQKDLCSAFFVGFIVGSILQQAAVFCVWTTWERYLKREGSVGSIL
jgi:hypothetical protein